MPKLRTACTSGSSRGHTPGARYGGTQRMVVWLARGLATAGHRVTLIAGHGSRVPEATVISVAVDAARGPAFDIRPLLPPGLDILVTYAPLRVKPDHPWLRVLPGNRKPGVKAAPNIIYLSRDHARRHGSETFVYNGVDPAEFQFRRDKDDYDLFLGRLHAAKGYRWAVAGAKRLRRRLLLAGGWRPSLSRMCNTSAASAGPEGGAAGRGRRTVDAGALGRAVRHHADRGAGERHAGARHAAGRRCRRSCHRMWGRWVTRWTSWWSFGPGWTRWHRRPAAARGAALHPSRDGGGLPADVPGVSGDRGAAGGEAAGADPLRSGATRTAAPSPAPRRAGRPAGACRCARPAPAAGRLRPPAPTRPDPAAPPRAAS